MRIRSLLLAACAVACAVRDNNGPEEEPSFDQRAESWGSQRAGGGPQGGNVSGPEAAAAPHAAADSNSAVLLQGAGSSGSALHAAADSNSTALHAAADSNSAGAVSGYLPAPLIVNRCQVPLVVYLERGILFNRQVIKPGEAVNLYSDKMGPRAPWPYNIVALVGDETSVPDGMDSLLHFVGVSAVPAAFVGGVLVSVLTGGAAVAVGGAAAAATPAFLAAMPEIALAGGLSLGAADVSAGIAASGVGKKLTDKMIKEHPKSFMVKKKRVFPGTKYFEVTGGPGSSEPDDPKPTDTTEGTKGELRALALTQITQEEYSAFGIADRDVKVALALESLGYVPEAAFTIEDCGVARAVGRWRRIGTYNDRARYKLIGGQGNFQIHWSGEAWHMFTTDSWWEHFRSRWFNGWPESLYKSGKNSGTAPVEGWEAVLGGEPVPQISKFMATEDEEEDEETKA